MDKPTFRSWKDLSADCLHIIFSKLGLDDLTVSIPFVCKSWFQASSNSSLHQTLDFRLLDLNPSSPFSRIFSSRYSIPRFTFSCFLKLGIILNNGAAHELRFSPLFPPSMEVLSLASTACPRLKTISLPPINFEDEARFLDLIIKWWDLEWLEMESKPSNLKDLVKHIGMHCNRFQGLKVRGSIKKEDVVGIVDFLPKIGILDLSGCQIGKEEVLAVLDGCRALKRLSLKDCVGLEVDDQVQRRAAGVDVFEFEGCRVEGEFRDFINPARDMHPDDCTELWGLYCSIHNR